VLLYIQPNAVCVCVCVCVCVYVCVSSVCVCVRCGLDIFSCEREDCFSLTMICLFVFNRKFIISTKQHVREEGGPGSVVTNILFEKSPKKFGI
jgi:hypothetical protein